MSFILKQLVLGRVDWWIDRRKSQKGYRVCFCFFLEVFTISHECRFIRYVTFAVLTRSTIEAAHFH